jgi:hypothetical protein
MAIPEFDHGLLPAGLHLTSLEELKRQFIGQEGSRRELCPALESLHCFANETHAEFYIIGGSFVTDQKDPRDVDVILVYRTKAVCPENRTIARMRRCAPFVTPA